MTGSVIVKGGRKPVSRGFAAGEASCGRRRRNRGRQAVFQACGVLLTLNDEFLKDLSVSRAVKEEFESHTVGAVPDHACLEGNRSGGWVPGVVDRDRTRSAE